MSTLTYDFAPGSTVFIATEATGVRSAVISSVAANILPTSTAVNYHIVYTKTKFGIATVSDAVLFADIDSALAAYKALVLAP
jgi:ABC-type phosphonate transport system ATPase subunit